MVLPVVTFSDAESAVYGVLTAAYVDRVETYIPTSVSVDIPSDVLDDADFRVQIAYEAPAPGDQWTKERSQVRVTCWSSKAMRTAVQDLASLSLGLLIAHASDGDVGPIRRLLGRSGVITDPDTGNLACWFLVRVNLNPTQLP